MPKTKRSPQEVAAYKLEILHQATELICDQGYKGFSMRKLASRLGITAKTIYNYYQGKDEIYLSILTEGFQQLFTEVLAAQQASPDPWIQLQGMVGAYLDFGLNNPHLYNLMFTWVVPKYNDYLGTDMEPIAQIELETALKAPLLFIQTILAYAQQQASPLSDEDARIVMIQFWTQAHGYVAGINNTLMDYMHEAPLSLKDHIVAAILSNLDRVTNPS